MTDMLFIREGKMTIVSENSKNKRTKWSNPVREKKTYTHTHTHTHIYQDLSISISCSVVSDSLLPHGLYPTRLLCPCNSPGKKTRVGCHSLLQPQDLRLL